MDLQKISEQKPAIMIGIAVIVLGIALWRLFGGSPASFGGQWFLDLQTGELIVYPGRDHSPVTLANGHQAVLAHVWACGSCKGVGKTNIVYLEKWSEEALAYWRDREAGAPGDQVMDRTDEPDRLVAAPAFDGGEIQWHYSRSPLGMRLAEQRIQIMRGQCGTDLVFCRP